MIDVSLLVTIACALALLAAVQRRELVQLRWRPGRHTAGAIAAGLLPALLSGVCLIVDRGSSTYAALLWLGIFGFCGFTVPFAYVLFAEGGSLADLGIRRDKLWTSLLVSSVFAAGATAGLLQKSDLSRYPLSHLLGSAAQLNVGGLFETLLYAGLVHLRLRDAFGPLPAILGSAALYSLWHIGTELPLHADPVAALTMLFAVGVLCQSLFATTYNLLAIWPIFFTAGVMHDFVVNLDLPDAIGTAHGWTAVGWALAIGVPSALWWAARRRKAP